MTIEFLTAVSDWNNLRGHFIFVGMSQNQDYTHLRSSDLQNENLFRDINSAILWESYSTDSTMILFENHLGFFNYGDYNGRFIQLTNLMNSGNYKQFDSLAPWNFNNVAGSLMLVNTRSMLRFSFRDLVLRDWNRTLDQMLQGSPARRNGNPMTTWEMFPRNVSHLSSNLTYLKIHQRLRIELPWWPDYDASITYHIYLYLDWQGRVRGHVVRWAYWVEGGIKSGSIADQLEPQVIAGTDTINDVLDDKLAMFEDFSLSRLYYLPGNQTQYPPGDVVTGSTFSDVTIVAEF